MPTQLNLFPAPMRTCDFGKHLVGVSPRNPILWDGFWDTKFKLFVCMCCKPAFYRSMGRQVCYSEMPQSIYMHKPENITQ